MLALLANTAIRMVLVGAMAWIAIRILRPRNPHVEVLLWRLILLAGLTLPLLLFWGLAPEFATEIGLPAIVAGTGAAPTAPETGPDGTLPAGLLLSIYLGGAALLLVRLIAGLAGTWRVCRSASRLQAHGDVRISARVRSPATFGAVILLPAEADEWPAARLDAVLIHERAHVDSRDGYWSWLAQLHAAIFWFNPLSWWLARRLEVLAETTSDDAVVAASHDPLAYAALLLDFARHPNSRSVVMSVAESNVPARIERLLARTAPGTALSRVVRGTALAALIPVVVFAASTTQSAPAQQPEPAAAPVPAVQSSEVTGAHILKAVNPDNFYPLLAKQERVTGYAVVKVALDPLGQLVKVDVVDVQPADPRFGFADAAIQVAQNTSYANPSQKDSSLKFMVKFALSE